MSTAPSQLFLNAVLSLDGFLAPLTPVGSTPEGALIFEVSAEAAAFFDPRLGQVAIAQTRSGVVLTRLRLVEVDRTANTLTALPSDRLRRSRMPLTGCALGPLSAHKRRG